MPRFQPASSPRFLPGRSEERTPIWWLRWVPAALLTLLLAYLIYVVGKVAIVPVLASFSLAYVLNPIVESIEKRGFSRVLAALLAVFGVGLFLVSFLWFIIPDLWHQSAIAVEIVMRAFGEENALIARENIRDISPMLDQIVGRRVYSFLRDRNSLIEVSQSAFAGGLTNFLATAANLVDLLLIPFFVFYILVDFHRWRHASEDLIPPRFRDPFRRLFDETGRILQAYVLGQLMIAMLMGVLYAIGFAFLKVPAWPGIAALSGFLNVIPYVGTGLGLILASGFTFASSGELWRVAGVGGIFLLVQMVEGYYLTPRILGDRLSLHPMAVFLGLLIGGKLFGFLGVLLSVPVLAVAQVFVKFMREIYKSSDFYQSGEMGPEAPPATAEDVIAKAADTVLAEQVEKQEGDEVLAPSALEDDAVARRTNE